MIIPDKKKAATIILSKLKKGGGETSDVEMKPEMAMDEDTGSLMAIAEDVMAAISSKSAHDLMVALKAFCSNCEQTEE